MPSPFSVPRPTPLPLALATLTGLPLLLGGLVLLCGSLANATTLLAFSILCTAGIGVFFWLGIAIVLGLVTLYVVDQLLRWRGLPHGSGLFSQARGVQVLQRRQRVLEQYLARRLIQGMDPVRVRQDLLEAGWGEPQLQEAFRAVRGR
ncbi:MAG: hypothetical protein ACKOZW_10915 [Cyanobium sp.]